MKCKGFAAIANANARVLILGTLPGKIALERGQYYAQPRNLFWKIMESLVGVSSNMSYEDRILCLQENGIALWDVLAAAKRPGSLDSAIHLPSCEINDFNIFFNTHSSIEKICFNGKLAHKIYLRRVLPNLSEIFQNIRLEVLPSTSPAHAVPIERKLLSWQVTINGK